MSHMVSVECFVEDNLTTLETVANTLGLVLDKNVSTFKWYGQWVNDFSGQTAAVTNGHDPKTFGQCVHKLRRADANANDYEIGLVRRLDGQPGYELVYDNWGTGGRRIEELAGKNLGTLKDELLTEAAIRVQARAGYRAIRSKAADGAIELTFIK
jgi:hypothetical protein